LKGSGNSRLRGYLILKVMAPCSLYSEMLISRENVIMCCLVRDIDGYRAMVEW
jgi:hypothetical protein